jgi:hypothetical protein
MDTDLQLAPDAPVDEMPYANALTIFEDIGEQVCNLIKTSDTIKVRDMSDTVSMALAGDIRKQSKKIRIRLEEKRLDLVEIPKRRTNQIDTAARMLKRMLLAVEAKMLEAEEYADRAIAARRAELLTWRTEQLTPLVEPLALDLGAMRLADIDDKQFESLHEELKSQLRDKEAQAQAALRAAQDAEDRRKAEEERLREENARLQREAAAAEAERQRVAAETAAREKAIRDAAEAEQRKRDTEARLAREVQEAAQAAMREQMAREQRQRDEEARKQREAIELKARQERAAAEAIAAAERAKAKALQDQIDAENARKAREAAAQAEAARKLAAAGDAAQLRHLAATLRGVAIPVLSDAALQASIGAAIEALAGRLDRKAGEL